MSKVSIQKLTKDAKGNAGNLLGKVRSSKSDVQKQILTLQGFEKLISQRIQDEKARKLELQKQQAEKIDKTLEVQSKKEAEPVKVTEKPEADIVEEVNVVKDKIKETILVNSDNLKKTSVQKPAVEKSAKDKEPRADSDNDIKQTLSPKIEKEKPKIKAVAKQANPKTPIKDKQTKKPSPVGLTIVKHAPTEEDKRKEEEKLQEAREKFRQRNKERNKTNKGSERGRVPHGTTRYQGRRDSGSAYQGNKNSDSNYQGNRETSRGYQGSNTRSNASSQRDNSNNRYNRPSNFRKDTDKDTKNSVIPIKPTRLSNSNFNRNRRDRPKTDKNVEASKPKAQDKAGKYSNSQLVYGDVYIPTGSRRKNRRRTFKSTNIERIVIEKAVINSDNVSIKELSEKIGHPGAEIIKKLMELGVFASINQFIDFDTAELVANEFDIVLEQKLEKSQEELMIDIHEESHVDENNFVQKVPVVTVMGHVDHGKTSLLDSIRNTNVLETEAGGITQHIGAYTIEHDSYQITFIDTPGHEAFTSMRARGAQVTDIAVLVVAADDGVMSQTIEAINHAKAAKVPIIVAINKIDLPSANPEKVMQELTEYGIVAEAWGGDAIIAKVSAVTGEGLDELLEMILLQAEMLELKANPEGKAVGTIIESRLEIGRGPVATVIIKNGTLHIGDAVVAGLAAGRVRAITDDKGMRMESAGPAIPIEVIGFSEIPEAGDEIYAADDKLSRRVAQERKTKQREDMVQSSKVVTLDELFGKIAQGKIKELNLIIKADVQGSAEAVRQSLEKLTNDEVRIKCIHSGVGAITENDVMLAAASNAIIIGFNISPDANGRSIADEEGVEIRTYRIIYKAIEDIELAMKGLLDPIYEEVINGHAQIRNVFKITGSGIIAGCYVTDGVIKRSSKARILRDSVVVYESTISSLKRFKDDVREVAQNFECGISIENFSDIKENDVIEAYETIEIKR